jgi:hypothetical protein
VLELAPTIRCPTLFIRGDEESPETYPAERFKERAGGPCDVEIVPNCNHFYVGREATICKVVSGWLVRTLNIGAGVSHLISSQNGSVCLSPDFGFVVCHHPERRPAV